MKKIIILITLVFLFVSCSNNITSKENKKNYVNSKEKIDKVFGWELEKVEKEENKIIYEEIGKNYLLSINNEKDLNLISDLFSKKDLKKYEIWFNVPYKEEYIKYFSKLSSFEKLSLDIYKDGSDYNIEKLLKLIAEKSKLNKDKSVLVLAFMNKKYFSEKEYKILENIKISVLEIQWFNIKAEDKNLDFKINKLLKNSKFLKKIIIQDYKKFDK